MQSTRLADATNALVDNLTWGIGWGMAMAAAYSVVALAIYAIAGQHAISSPGLTIWKLLLGYWFGGTSGGILVGLTRPLLRYRAVLGLIGAFTGILAGVGIQAARHGLPWTWSTGDWITTVLIGALFGCLAAYDWS